MHTQIPHTLARMGAAAGLVLALGLSAPALGQERSPAVRSAISECETTARSGQDAARALGACDFALRDSSLSEDERARVHLNRAALSTARGDGRSAMTDLNAAQSRLGELPQFHLTLSAAQIRTGDFNAAEASARRALQLGWSPLIWAISTGPSRLSGSAAMTMPIWPTRKRPARRRTMRCWQRSRAVLPGISLRVRKTR